MFTDEIAKYAKVNMSKIIRGQQKDKTNTSGSSTIQTHVNKCVPGWCGVVVVLFCFVSHFLSLTSEEETQSEGLKSSERESSEEVEFISG